MSNIVIFKGAAMILDPWVETEAPTWFILRPFRGMRSFKSHLLGGVF